VLPLPSFISGKKPRRLNLFLSSPGLIEMLFANETQKSRIK
jgi:hypothetical protein